jgi:hypothetical protein
MVFNRLGAGFITGMFISCNAHEYVYMTIASCFVRPHWRFQKLKKERISKEMAVPTELLDSYVKDVLGSFALFWVIIIPVFYKAYISKDGFGE